MRIQDLPIQPAKCIRMADRIQQVLDDEYKDSTPPERLMALQAVSHTYVDQFNKMSDRVER